MSSLLTTSFTCFVLTTKLPYSFSYGDQIVKVCLQQNSFLRATWRTFKAQAQKNKKIQTKKFLIFWEMELSCSNVKKNYIFSKKSFSYIFSKEIFFYISKNGALPKNKKRPPQKNSLYFRKWNVLALISKEILHFWKWNHALFRPSSKNKNNPPRENFLSFRKRKPLEFSYFLKKICSYISETFYILGNRDPEKTSYISGSNFQSSKNDKKHTLEKLLIFQEIKLFNPSLEKILIYQEVTSKFQA